MQNPVGAGNPASGHFSCQPHTRRVRKPQPRAVAERAGNRSPRPPVRRPGGRRRPRGVDRALVVFGRTRWRGRRNREIGWPRPPATHTASPGGVRTAQPPRRREAREGTRGAPPAKPLSAHAPPTRRGRPASSPAASLRGRRIGRVAPDPRGVEKHPKAQRAADWRRILGPARKGRPSVRRSEVAERAALAVLFVPEPVMALE